VRKIKCAKCGHTFKPIPAYFYELPRPHYECPECYATIEWESVANPPEFILPRITAKAAEWMRKKYTPIPGVDYEVHEITYCLLKKKYREQYPEIAEATLYKPSVQVGEAIHAFIEGLPAIDAVQKVFKKRANRYLIGGRPDIVNERAVYDIKFVTKMPKEPLPHHVLSAGVYAWLTDRPEAHVVYISPRTFREYVVSPVPVETVIRLIERPRYPLWDWEDLYCPFVEICPYAKVPVRRAEGGGPKIPGEIPELRETSREIPEWYEYSRHSVVLDRLAAEYGIKYKLPDLPELEDNVPNRRVLAMAIDTEGTIVERLLRFDKIDGYRYSYLYPAVVFMTTTEPLTKEVARLMGVPVYTYTRPEKITQYIADAHGPRAVAVLLLVKPYMRVPEKVKRAEEILKKFRERPTVHAEGVV